MGLQGSDDNRVRVIVILVNTEKLKRDIMVAPKNGF